MSGLARGDPPAHSFSTSCLGVYLQLLCLKDTTRSTRKCSAVTLRDSTDCNHLNTRTEKNKIFFSKFCASLLLIQCDCQVPILKLHCIINISGNNKFTQNNFRSTSIALCWENRQEKWHVRACCRNFYDSLLSILFSYTSNHQFSYLFHTVFSPHRNVLNTPLLVSH